MVGKTKTENFTDHGDRRPRSGRRGPMEECRASSVVNMRNPCKKEKEKPILNTNNALLRVGTWNVTSMFESGKINNVVQEMSRLKIDILGVSEVRWPGSGQIQLENETMYFSGNNEAHHRNGVAIIVTKRIAQCVTSFVPLSDRIMLLQLRTNTCRLNIIQIYAPTADKTDDENEVFYNQLDTILQSTKSRDATIVLGDFNSKIGKGRSGHHVGGYGLGERNERGDRLIQFCQEKNMIITNTFYKLPNRRLYTWKSPQDNVNRVVRNQIDYILINERYRNSVKAVKAYPGADVNSNHNPIIAKVHIKLKKIRNKINQNQIDISKLQDPNIRNELQKQINDNIAKIRTHENGNHTHINDKWEGLKSMMMEPTRTLLQKERTKRKQQWITDDILQLMDKRRKFKWKDDKYREIQKEIRVRVRRAKEEFFKRKCEEVEELQVKHDYYNIHKRIKELTGTQKRRQQSVLVNEKGQPIIEVEEKLKIWEEYVRELFRDERNQSTIEYTQRDEGPEITKEEVMYAIKTMKNRKAPGPDELPAEILKLIEEDQIQILVDLYNTIYTTGIIPNEWLLSTFVTLPKKTNARGCSDYRTISLMSHTLKAFLKIIHNRIYKKLEQDISENQFGFRNGLGTREALFALNVISQRCLDMNKDVYICFIDYNKAFDKVRHDHLMRLLKEKGIDDRDVRIISRLYYNQKANIRIDQNTSKEIEIERGVRQGCVLSPTLFNLYSEDIISRALETIEDRNIGIKINGTPINNLRYADDTALLAETLPDLQALLTEIVEMSDEYGLSINIKKTKYMLVSKSTQNIEHLYVHDQIIERVHKYNYLGTWINEHNDSSMEMKTRIEKARNTFMKMKKALCGRDLNLDLKVRLVRCYVLPVLYYGMETWTMKKTDIRRIESFELWMYRRILRIPWVDKVTNITVLSRMKKEKEILLTIKRRKMQYLGHIMRGEKYGLLQLIIEGKIVGRRSIGRRRHSWLKNLRDWYHCSNSQLFRSAASKVKIALMIANLRNEDGT